MRKKVMISGGFDPLHIGHIDLMERAAGYGDLIVVVNDDDFLKRKKGFVFMPLNDRIKIISSLRFVDTVIPAYDKDDTVCLTLEKIRPDIFANGGDRDEDNIPEDKICKRLGIKMLFGLGTKIRSSSELVKKAGRKK